MTTPQTTTRHPQVWTPDGRINCSGSPEISNVMLWLPMGALSAMVSWSRTDPSVSVTIAVTPVGVFTTVTSAVDSTLSIPVSSEEPRATSTDPKYPYATLSTSTLASVLTTA